jgi:hypothetical protein
MDGMVETLRSIDMGRCANPYPTPYFQDPRRIVHGYCGLQKGHPGPCGPKEETQ